MNVPVKFLKLHPDARVPEYKSAEAACLDLCACEPDGVQIMPGFVKMIRTGIAVELEPGWELQIRPRSGLATKGITVVNAPGTIDSDFRGEVCVLLINHSPLVRLIDHQDRIAQVALKPVYRAVFEEVDDLTPTERGAGGFGSTGV